MSFRFSIGELKMTIRYTSHVERKPSSAGVETSAFFTYDLALAFRGRRPDMRRKRTVLSTPLRCAPKEPESFM
jgi:hypothetical protein